MCIVSGTEAKLHITGQCMQVCEQISTAPERYTPWFQEHLSHAKAELLAVLRGSHTSSALAVA